MHHPVPSTIHSPSAQATNRSAKHQFPATSSEYKPPVWLPSQMDIPKGDKLVLRGLKFHGYHGVKPEEAKLGQKFVVDVDAWMDLQPAGKSDCLSDTLSYTDVYKIVKEVVEGPPRKLLEKVAELIASTTLDKYPQVSAVRVQVGKPHVAVQGTVDYLGVEIIRQRNYLWGRTELKRRVVRNGT